MFKGINGDEAGLLAAYNFDAAAGDEAPDVSGNGNDATGNSNFIGTEWVPSTAIIADTETESAMELTGIWNGLTSTDPRFTTATHGMNMLATELTNTDYVVFGHQGGSGVTTDDIPTNASPMFERAQRVWSLTNQSATAVTVLMNLSQIAGGGAELDGSYPNANYTLLYRPHGGNTFSSAANGTAITSGVVTFNAVSLQSGEYTIGVGDGIVQSIGEETNAFPFALFPNPTVDQLVLDLGENTSSIDMRMTNTLGAEVCTGRSSGGGLLSFDLSHFESGVYFIRIEREGKTYTSKFVKN